MAPPFRLLFPVRSSASEDWPRSLNLCPISTNQDSASRFAWHGLRGVLDSVNSKRCGQKTPRRRNANTTFTDDFTCSASLHHFSCTFLESPLQWPQWAWPRDRTLRMWLMARPCKSLQAPPLSVKGLAAATAR